MGEKETLARLVGIGSEFPNEERIGAYLEKTLRSYGFSTRRDYVEGRRFNILAERGKGPGGSLLFYGHMDTVPRYGSWKTDPLRLTESGDRLYGLGTHDMKGGIAALLEGIRRDTGRRIKVLLCVDEENISRGAWHAVHGNRRWFSDVRAIIAAEAGVAEGNEGGASTITLGRRGRCVIAVEVRGRSAHGAEPGLGISAISETAKIALHIGEIRIRRHPKLRSESVFVREIAGGSTSLSVPDHAYLELDMHLVPPGNSADARRRIEAYLGRLRRSGVLAGGTRTRAYVKGRETPYLEPYATPASSLPVSRAMAVMRRRTGRVHVNYGMSVADENVLAVLGKPVMTIGPEGGNEHSANEWVSERSLRETAELYRSLIASV